MPCLIEYFLDESGRTPFLVWLNAVRDQQAKTGILRRLYRLELGHFGDCKFCRDGIWELRIDTGAGYRVYYARTGKDAIILLCGGDKSTQQSNIQRASNYWQSWNKRNP